MASLTEILQLIEESLDQPDVDASALASRAHLSRFHFDRIASGLLGEPPAAFRRRLLLERAAHRLSTTADPVIEVALDAGYDSPDAFGRAFRRGFGTTPSEHRRSHAGFRLPTGNGIHFHPPGGLRLPTLRRSTAMDTLIAMYDHHIDTTRAILARLDAVPEALDAPIELSVEGIDRDPTLRSLSDRLVRQLEMWVTAVGGGTRIAAGVREPAAMIARLDAAAPRFRELVVDRVADGEGDTTFVDATCEPPETFTLSGVLAHVLTFAAVRRTLAIGALESAGIDDLGSGDPMTAVGGEGRDASEIRRAFQEAPLPAGEAGLEPRPDPA